MAKRREVHEPAQLKVWQPGEQLHLWFSGRPISKKRSLMVKRTQGAKCPRCDQSTGRTFVGPSYDYEKQYERPNVKFVRQWIKDHQHKIIDTAVRCIFLFRMPNFIEADLPNLMQAPMDVLTEAGFWTDDCLVKSVDGSRMIVDKESPGTYIWVREYQPVTADAEYICEWTKRRVKRIERTLKEREEEQRIGITPAAEQPLDEGDAV